MCSLFKNSLSVYEYFVDQLLKKYIKKNFKVFDCGCGNGDHSSIAKKYANKVIGGDFVNFLNTGHGIEFRQISENYYGNENEFDAVISFDVIEHVKDPRLYLKMLANIVKSQGVIIIGTPNRFRLSNKIIELFHGKITYPRNLGYHLESGGDIIHIREFTMPELVTLGESVPELKVVEKLNGFIGLYTLLGAMGIKSSGLRSLEKFAQHLFIVYGVTK